VVIQNKEPELLRGNQEKSINLFQSEVRHFHTVRAAHPQNVIASRKSSARHIQTPKNRERNTPDQHQAQTAGVLAINKLFRIPQQHIHVRIYALERAPVLGLAPFQADHERGADSRMNISTSIRFLGVAKQEEKKSYLACKKGRGFTG
jgi:hypothetical protein